MGAPAAFSFGNNGSLVSESCMKILSTATPARSPRVIPDMAQPAMSPASTTATASISRCVSSSPRYSSGYITDAATGGCSPYASTSRLPLNGVETSGLEPAGSNVLKRVDRITDLLLKIQHNVDRHKDILGDRSYEQCSD